MTTVRARRVTAATAGAAILLSGGTILGQTPRAADIIRSWLERHVAVFNAKDLEQLGAYYHPDVTIFEGGGVDRGWIMYRNHHLGPELKDFDEIRFARTNVEIQMLSDRTAYITAEYSLRGKVAGRPIDSGGLETLVLVRDAEGAWKIRHSHTSSRRRPAPQP